MPPLLTFEFPDLEVFFDSACPLCAREIGFVRQLQGAHRIQFTDIASPDFSTAGLGISLQMLEGQIHGRVWEGNQARWIVGVDVFRSLYHLLSWRGVRLAPLVKISRLPGISGILSLGYWGFARIRVPLGRLLGRPDCEGTCRVGS